MICPRVVPGVLILFAAAVPCLAGEPTARVVEAPLSSGSNAFYVVNRSPLLPSPLLKLPIGSITPKGWLRHQLELEAQGMTGRLPEVSKWCKFESNAWVRGEGHSGWEELPYWLKGYGDLGYVLGDAEIIRTARKWIDGVLATQLEDGWFGPKALKTSLEGKPDLWPHMVMCNVLQSYFEYTRDPRVLVCLTKYFQWLNERPADNFGAGYWPKIRFGDNIESVYWLYNRTGDRWLLALSEKIHKNMARWDTGVINWHNVNIAQGFREPALYYLQSGDAQLLQAAESNYQTVIGKYGQFPGGGFAGDENCRPGYTDPRQGLETCGFVEFMHSFEMLAKISGNPVWADRCEEIAFNSLPAAMTPDLKGLHYLTCANQPQLDKGNKAPGVQNRGTMFSYSPFETYRCCQHNVSHGWPYYAEELWLATLDGGLCASLYAASEVKAKVAGGLPVTITEQTDYPFADSVKLTVSAAQPVRFPLYLRIPGWCKGAEARINGKRVNLDARPWSYLLLERMWKTGDTILLRLPMTVSVHRWTLNRNAASVDYGPLTFSLKIGESWAKCGGTDAWPEWEVFPTTPWNYGLVLDAKRPESSFRVERSRGAPADQPFTPETAPVRLITTGRRIAAWKLDAQGLIEELPSSPVTSDAPVESVTLIPMGAARLRISAFPVVEGSKTAK